MATREENYLLGPPRASTVDPRLWGFGRRPSHRLVVREASSRLTALAAARQGLLPSPLAAVRPAVWGGPMGVLATQEKFVKICLSPYTSILSLRSTR